MPDCSACIDRQCPSRASCALYLMEWEQHRQSVSPSIRDGGQKCGDFMSASNAPFALLSMEDADCRAKFLERAEREQEGER